MLARGTWLPSPPAPEDRDNNRGTYLGGGPYLPIPDAVKVFKASYDAFAPALRAATAPGYAVVAVRGRGPDVAALRIVETPARHPVAVIVGRHTQCQVHLDGVDDLALRQLAILVEPPAAGATGPARCGAVRVFDLHTSTAFRDDRGRVLRGLRADGPAILRCVGYTLFLLPVGPGCAWPERAADAWASLPTPSYEDARAADPRHLAPRSDERITHVTALRGPRGGGGDAAPLVEPDEPAGVLELHVAGRVEQARVGERALRDGVLIGRYDRCDLAGPDEHVSLSRVHALVLRHGDDLLLIDTASTNGLWRPGQEPEAVLALAARDEVALSDDCAVRWRWLA